MRALVLAQAVAGLRAEVTFSRDIRPLLERHCVACHRPGEVAPFSLLRYEDAAGRSRMLAEVVRGRRMPPWKAVPAAVRFHGARRLTDREIGLFSAWDRAGAPKGGETNPIPEPGDAGWRLGPPDLTLKLPRPFPVPGGGPDLYQCFALPTDLPGDRYVRAADFRPGNRRLVHHALFFADSSGASRRLAGGAGNYPCFGLPGFLPSAGLGGWSPGNSAYEMPPGTGTRLGRGAMVVLQIHYHPSGRAEEDASELGLYFAASSPRQRLFDVALGSREIDIPPGAVNHRVTDHFTLPVDVWAWEAIPHAHYVARAVRAVAEMPGRRPLVLLEIRDWDFNWQERYRFAEPLRLPAGTRLRMEWTYDNSAANARNPNSPPKRVLWGPGTADEMAGLHVQVTPVQEADAAELAEALWGKFMRTVGGGFPGRAPE
ncbi:MAG: ascorbate-dependent monooxygenase [Acidobacteria bacterium]|nr:ascorbate-dependent monooxygenase [Acidobacteriota bacterium]